jgi:hypothetical protein
LNCKRFNLPLETWRRQESAFGLVKKVYARRAQLRGQQPLNATSSFHAAPVANGEEKNAAPGEPSELERWWRDVKPTDYETDTDNPGLPLVGL